MFLKKKKKKIFKFNDDWLKYKTFIYYFLSFQIIINNQYK